MKRIIALLLMALSSFVIAAGDTPHIALEKVNVNIHDKASIERGAKFFAQNCMVCHTMRYLQHNKIAAAVGITLDKMPLKQKEWWLGVVPPDLTLIARVRGPRWLYTYFHSFYKDPKRPTGFNNLLANNINMMNVFASLQGIQVLTPRGKKLIAEEGEHGFRAPRYYTVLELVKSGSMTPAEFNQTMTDLVNFLVYASDPGKIHREVMGVWVILFLVILAILAYFLKKIYWKKIK